MGVYRRPFAPAQGARRRRPWVGTKVPTGGTNYTQTVTGGLSFTGAFAKSTRRPLTAAITPYATKQRFLIHHGSDVPLTTDVSSHSTAIDALPFDGLVVALLNEPLVNTTRTLAGYTSDIGNMPTLARVTQNFVRMVFTDTTYDWYDDTAWATRVTNVGYAASAASSSGKFVGVFLDTEYYGSGSNPWTFGDDSTATPWVFSATLGATPNHTQSDAQAKLQARGAAVAQAIIDNFPNAVIFTSFGPWVGETLTFSSGYSGLGANDVAYANELMGSFLTGVAEAVHGSTSATYVDGGEVYQARTVADFQEVANWNRTGLAASSTVILPTADKVWYPSLVSVGFMVYDKDVTNSNATFSAANNASNLTHALNVADRYVIAYSEAYCWMGTGFPSTAVPQADIDAVSGARATVSRLASVGLSRRDSHLLTAVLSFTGSQTRALTRALTAALSFAGALTRRTARALTGSVSFTGAFTSARTFLRSLTASVSFTGSQSKSTGHGLTGSVSFTGTATRAITHGLTAAVSFAGTLARRTARAVTAGMSFTGNVARKTGRGLTAAASFTGSLTRANTRALTAGLSSAGSLVRSTARALAANLSFTGAFSAVKNAGSHAYTQSLTAAVSFAGAVNRTTSRGLTAGLSFAGAVAKTTNRGLTAAVSFSGTALRRTARGLSAGLSFTGTVGKATGRALGAGLSFGTDLARSALGPTTRGVLRGVDVIRGLFGADRSATTTGADMAGNPDAGPTAPELGGTTSGNTLTGGDL